MQKKVGILLFDEVEVLDFAGPFEVFSLAALADGSKPFLVKTVSQHGGAIHARNGLTVIPDYSFANSPTYDILIIPGGYGAEEVEIHNPVLIEWIRESAQRTELLASVCTGALLLAQAGLLTGKKATTHWMDQDRLERGYPSVQVVRGSRFVDEGSIMTSGGISAGIHMCFHILDTWIGREAAMATARRMEYDLAWD